MEVCSEQSGGILSTQIEKVTSSGARKHKGSLPGPVDSKGNFVASADAALMPVSVHAQGTGGKNKLGRRERKLLQPLRSLLVPLLSLLMMLVLVKLP